jgi:hypothetical protein
LEPAPDENHDRYTVTKYSECNDRKDPISSEIGVEHPNVVVSSRADIDRSALYMDGIASNEMIGGTIR